MPIMSWVFPERFLCTAAVASFSIGTTVDCWVNRIFTCSLTGFAGVGAYARQKPWSIRPASELTGELTRGLDES
jgi:hypothetical protein